MRGNFWYNLCNVGAESAPSGWNRVKVSRNLGATADAPVAPAVTSPKYHAHPPAISKRRKKPQKSLLLFHLEKLNGFETAFEKNPLMSATYKPCISL